MGRRRKRTYLWDGIQITNQAVLVTSSPNQIAGIAAKGSPVTIVSIRGWLTWEAITSTGNALRAKILLVEMNDADAMTGDHAAFDSHEEDIAVRQLWTHEWIQSAINTVGTETVAVHVKTKIKMSGSSKQALVLLQEGTSTNRTRISMYLRCLAEM